MDEDGQRVAVTAQGMGVTHSGMRPFRVIPRLDIKLEHLIKGVQMEGWRKVGSPIEFAKKYAAEGADELVLTDVVASLYERNSLHTIVEAIASDIFIPLTIGGGIRSLADVNDLLMCGADKVTINTAATKDPKLITEISNRFGSQACVVAIETIFRDGKWQVMTDNGRNLTGYEAVAWAFEVEKLGAGEIILTSIHKEGLGLGMDIELIAEVSSCLEIPVVAGGGLGSSLHLDQLLESTEASGVAVAQALHWKKLELSDLRTVIEKKNYYSRPIDFGI